VDYPATRKAAKAQGATHYFTGAPCVRGHVALRKTKGACVECMREDWVTDNARRSLKPKTEAAKAAGRRYYERNREAVIARATARPESEVYMHKRAYKARHPELIKANVSTYKRRHREATPPWLTLEDRHAIRALYLHAQQMTRITGERYVVDHIVPLRSPEVCGLHVPWNLRVITQAANLQKSNKLVDPTPPP